MLKCIAVQSKAIRKGGCAVKKYIPQALEFLKKADLYLFFLCLASSIFGIVFISSAVAWRDDPGRYIFVQILALLLGIFLFILFTVIDIDVIADKWPLVLAFSVLLLLALIVFGQDDGTGNKSWIRFLGIGIQPSEIVRVTFIVLMAKQISYLKEYHSLNHITSVVQMCLHFGLFFGMILVISKDLGSALIFLFVFAVMLFAAGIKIYWFVLGISAIAAVTPFLWTNVLKEYQRNRIIAPYAPEIVDPKGDGITWQVNQSKLSLASGRLTGTGLFQGPQTQSGAVPEQQTDFIFAVIGEEFGLIGCLICILLLTLIIIRCVKVGLRSRNTMSMLVCFGVAAALLFQTFENIGMCIGLTPVIGITLPFFSYGGSSVFSMFAAMGIVSGIKFRPKPERFRTY